MSDHKETGSKNTLSPDDIDAWRQMTSDVKPLKGKKYIEIDAAADAPPSKKQESLDEPDVNERFVQSRPQSAQRGVKGREIDRNTLKRLRRGDLPLEGKLDLHGFNQEQAHSALLDFIRDASAAGKRCVLVVTGKGNTGRKSEHWLDRQPGVLKKNVPDWLNGSELRSLVLHHVPAQPKDGGDGALYVYLRRRR